MKKQEIKDLIEAKATYWARVLGLGDWDIDFKLAKRDREDELTAGEANVQWQYQQATITFYSKVLKGLDADAIEKIVVHELMHVFLNEMREEGIDHEERVATMLSKAFLWVKGVEK